MQLGRITKMNPRNIWAHEALDFTQWLVREENISVLCQELQINITNVRAEASAGRYYVDIVGDEIESNRKVVIENQLESTDHKHLGQLLTYASAFDASIIVWLVTDSAEEHRQAIDWFNHNMPESISFFLVQIEVYKIGDSDPAPKFNIICEPNNWSKTVKKSSKGDDVSDLKLLQKEFWEGLRSLGASLSSKVTFDRAPRAQHWYDVSIGTSRCHLALTINSQKKYVACEVYIRDDLALYATFLENRTSIETAVGSELEWMELPTATASRIKLALSCDPKNKENWLDYHQWLVTTVEKFSSAFTPHV